MSTKTSPSSTAPHEHGPDCAHEHGHEAHGHGHEAHGHVHGPNCSHHHHGATMPFVRTAPKVGRNDPCSCGSTKKYKKCCGASAAH